MACAARGAKPSNCTVVHIRRHFNEIADWLSKSAAKDSLKSGIETREAVDRILGKEVQNVN